MGWLEKIFGKKVAASTEPEQTHSIDDIKKLLDARNKGEMGPFLEAVKLKYGEIQNAAVDFEKSLEGLATANHSGPVDPHLLSVIVGRRKNFIRKIGQVAKQLKMPVKYDFDSILNYNNSASSALNNASTTTIEDYSIVVELFRKEAALVVENFRRIEDLLKELGSMVEEKNNFVNAFALSNDKILAIEGGIKAISEKRNLIKESRAGIESLDSDKSRISDEISNLEKSGEWNANIEMLKRRGGLQAQKSGLSGEMMQIVSPLVRPVKKFKNLLDNGRENFESRKYVELFMDDHIGTIVSNDIAIFSSLLEKLREGIASKKIDVGEKTGKILQAIDELKESGTMTRLKDGYVALSGEIEDLENAITNSRVRNTMKRLETELESVKRKGDEMNARLLEEESEMDSVLDKLEKDKSELELQASNLVNTRISLKLPS